MRTMAFVCIVLFGLLFLLFCCLALLTIAIPKTAEAIDKMILNRIKSERNEEAADNVDRKRTE